MVKRWLVRIGLMTTLALALLLFHTGGCATVGYYSQAINGHFELMRGREPLDEVLAADDTDEALRRKLETLVEARAFAVRELGLPENRSYSSYVETGRQAVTWNVVAAEEFSLDARRWCFPVAGCVNYRGYFDRDDALAYARELAEAGFDVSVGGASAYSTLGWFADPVLDTMLRGSEWRYVGTLFHELAHQRLYVENDSSFNEAYASFVEQEGIRRWLQARGRADEIERYEAHQLRIEDFNTLLRSTREELLAIYGRELDTEGMRAAKREAFDAMRARYANLKADWGGYAGFDRWFDRELNNARLVSVATYRRYIPAFAVLFAEADSDIERFHELARDLGQLQRDERRSRLDRLLESVRAS